jgi:hypothetical protein
MGIENYTLLLNSQNAVNRDASSGNINSYYYYVNWDSVLPKHYSKFEVSFRLKSITQATAITNNVILSVNFGHTNMNDQTGCPTSILGVIYPVVNNLTSSNQTNFYFNANKNDNFGITISYPTTNFIHVKFTDFDLADAVMYNYVLQLNFVPII